MLYPSGGCAFSFRWIYIFSPVDVRYESGGLLDVRYESGGCVSVLVF